MKEQGLAERYARAMVSLGQEEKCLERFRDELKRLKEAFFVEPQLIRVLGLKELAQEKKEGMLQSLSDQLLLSPFVRNFLSILLQRNKTGLLPLILNAFEEQVRLLEDVAIANVSVASKTESAPLIPALKLALETATKKKIEMDITEDASLIGGVRVALGNKIYDASLKGELQRLQKTWNGLV